MLDYQRIVDDVRSALFNNGQDGEDFLQGAAADYSLAVDELNQRLRHCGALLRKGLRSEALQLCEIEPNLLDVVAILDFPERESWNELLTMHGLGTPAYLLLDVAADLNEAYAIEEPLAALLQRHRMLAMGYGPMKLRVETLRSLAEADPESPFWDKDLRTLEQERLREIQHEVPQAIAAGDMLALATLTAELQSGRWREHPPQTLIHQITAARSNFARAEGIAELRRVGEQLREAFAACDVDGGSRLRNRWYQLNSVWGSSIDENAGSHVEPALQWLREQDELAAQEARHAAAVGALAQSLAKRKHVEELEPLHREAEREGEIPLPLEKRYCEHLAAIDQAARRRNRWALFGLSVAVMVVVALAVLVVRQQKHLGQVESAVQSLEQLLQDGKRDEASNFLDQLAEESPAVANDPRIQELNSRLKKELKSEDDRRQEFAAAVDAVRKSLEEKLPDRDLLARAEKLAISAEEHATVRKLDGEIKNFEQGVQSKIDQQFLSQLRELKDRVASVEKIADDNPESCSAKVVGLTNELKKLEDGSPQISAAARQPADLLRTRLKTLEDGIHNANERIGQEEQITDAVGDSTRFREQLTEYVRKNPQAPQATSFRDAAAESSLWDWLSQWNDLVRTVGRQNVAKLSRKDAADYVTKLKKLLEDRPGHPSADIFRQRLAFMEAVARRVDRNGSPIEAPLKPLFADPLVVGDWMLRLTDGQRYYLLQNPAQKLAGVGKNASVNFEYVVGFDLTAKKRTFRVGDIDSNKTAPQKAIAEKVTPILESLSDDNWESSFCKMAEAILADTETDPILKLFLLRKALTIGCQGSLCLEKAFSRHMEVLKHSKVPDAANWMDPNDSEGPRHRSNAEAELATFSDFIQAREAAAKEWRSLFVTVGSEYKPVGWLRQKLDRQWQCVAPRNEGRSGTLCIVRAADPNERKAGGAIVEAVGKMEKGKAVIDGASGPALLEGRPVFLAVPATQ